MCYVRGLHKGNQKTCRNDVSLSVIQTFFINYSVHHDRSHDTLPFEGEEVPTVTPVIYHSLILFRHLVAQWGVKGSI